MIEDFVILLYEYKERLHRLRLWIQMAQSLMNPGTVIDALWRILLPPKTRPD